MGIKEIEKYFDEQMIRSVSHQVHLDDRRSQLLFGELVCLR